MLPALIIIPMLKALFFKQVQNKMHWVAHKHTAAEVIYERADAEKENMGLVISVPLFVNLNSTDISLLP